MSDLIKYDPTYNASQATYLYNYVAFYRGLSESGKKKFHRRVKKFIASKDFQFFFDVGKEELLVKTLVAASCMQVTWALDDIYIGSFSYVGIYENGIQLKKAKGKSYNSMWLDNKVRFAWSTVKDGFVVPDDGHQIGLFEWTRALIMQAKKDNILDDFFAAYYRVWCEAAKDIMYVVDEDEEVPVELYGAKLPIIIQHFFEEPEELKKNHPEIYEHTKILLNLDLLEAKEYDYVYSKKIRKEKNIRSKNRVLLFGVQDKVRKFALPAGIMYFILVQIPVVVFIWFSMARWTYFSFSFWGAFIAIAAAGIFAVRRNYYVKRGITRAASIILFILGLIPSLYSVMHMLNYLIPVEHHVKVLPITEQNQLSNYLPWTGFTVPHVNKVIVTTRDFMDSEYKISAVYTHPADIQVSIPLLNKKSVVELHTYTGIFGARVFDGYVVTVRKN